MASETNTEIGNSDHGANEGVFPPFDSSTYGSQLLWLAITFGVLYYVMAKIIIPRIGSILEVRSDRIEQDLSEAQRLKNDADEVAGGYHEALSKAKQNAQAIVQASQDKAKTEAIETMTRMEADLSQKITAAEETILASRDRAMAEVDMIAGGATEQIVTALIGGRVTKTEVQQALKSIAG